MDSRQARQILMFYRPGETDKGDPLMAEALELARTDSDLASWFAQHCAAHAKILQAERIAAVEEQIKAKTAAPDSDRDNMIMLSRPALIMLSIAVVFLAALAAWHYLKPKTVNNFSSYRDRMARLVQRSYPMRNTFSDQARIREYFLANGAPADFAIPRNLEKLPGKGSAVFTWHEGRVFLMGADAGGNTNLFLFIVADSLFDKKTLAAAPRFDRVGNFMTAIWTNENEVYLLAGPSDETFLQNYLH